MMYYVLHYIFLEICTFIVDNKLQKLRRKTHCACQEETSLFIY